MEDFAPFIAKLTAKTSSGGVWLYSWEEYQGQPNSATRIQAYPGRQGSSTISPAREVNNQEVAVNTLVLMWCRGMVAGQVAFEFAAPDGSLSTAPATLTQHYIGFGSAVNLLTGNSRFTYTNGTFDGVLALTNDGESALDLTSYSASERPIVRLSRAGGTTASPSDGATTGELGRVSAERLISSVWTEQAYLSFQMQGGERWAVLSAYNDLDGCLRVKKTGSTPGTIADLLAEQVNIGIAGGQVMFGPAATASRLLGTDNGGYLREVTNGTGLTYDAGTGVLASSVSAYTDEQVDDRVATLIQNGTGITWSYNDGANTLTPTVTITQYTDEMARDALGTALTEGLGIEITVNDGSDTITIERKFRGVRVYRNATGNTPGTSSTWGGINFDAENYDTDAFHDNATNNNRITIPTGMGGYYQLAGHIIPTSTYGTTGQYLQIRLIVNGTTVVDEKIGEMLASGTWTTHPASGVWELAAGDYVELQMAHSGGTPLTYYNYSHLTWMSAYFLGIEPP